MVAGVGLVAILALTLYPNPRQAPVAQQTPLLCLVCGETGGADVALNLLLFMPLAAGLALLGWPWTRIVAGCALLSLGVETLPNAENIDRLADSLEGRAGLATQLKAASRMTITPTMLDAGVKSNSIPDRCKLICDVRALPGQDDRFVQAELEHLLGGLGVEIEVQYTAIPNASPSDSPFIADCHRALELALGESVQILPGLTVGFTDSRFLRPLGTEVYGFAPHAPSAVPERTGVHGNNEFIEVDTLLLRTKTALALACLTLGLEA